MNLSVVDKCFRAPRKRTFQVLPALMETKLWTNPCSNMKLPQGKASCSNLRRPFLKQTRPTHRSPLSLNRRKIVVFSPNRSSSVLLAFARPWNRTKILEVWGPCSTVELVAPLVELYQPNHQHNGENTKNNKRVGDEIFMGIVGFEPTITKSKSAALPLGYIPKPLPTGLTYSQNHFRKANQISPPNPR